MSCIIKATAVCTQTVMHAGSHDTSACCVTYRLVPLSRWDHDGSSQKPASVTLGGSSRLMRPRKTRSWVRGSQQSAAGSLLPLPPPPPPPTSLPSSAPAAVPFPGGRVASIPARCSSCPMLLLLPPLLLPDSSQPEKASESVDRVSEVSPAMAAVDGSSACAAASEVLSARPRRLLMLLRLPSLT